MKISHRLLFLLAVAYSMNVSHAQWVQTNGPYGGYVACFAELNSLLFAGSSYGIYASTDRGISWKPATERYPSLGVRSMLLVGTKLFAATSAGVLVSSDNGATWTQMNNGLPNLSLYGIAALQNTSGGTDMYAATFSSGVYVSVDGGQSWSSVGLSGKYLNSLAANGTDLYACTSSGLFRSVDGGANWTALTPSTANYSSRKIAFRRSPSGASELFLGTQFNGVMYSGDNGATWIQMNTGLNDRNIYSIAFAGQDLFVTAYFSGIFVLRSNALSWTLSNTGHVNPRGGCIFPTTAPNGQLLLLSGARGGIFRSTDSGSTWSSSCTGLAIVDGACFANSIGPTGSEQLYAGFTDVGLLVTTDLGSSWQTRNAGFLDPFICSLQLDAGTGGGYWFAGTSDGVYRSTDRGNSWTAVNSETRGWYLYAMAAAQGYIFASRDLSMYRSSDNGTTWNPIVTGWVRTTVTELLTCTPPGGTPLLLASNTYNPDSPSGIFVSSDFGDTWKQLTNGLPSGVGPGCLVLDRDASGAANIIAGFGTGIYISSDYGETWTSKNSGLSSLSISSCTSYRRQDGMSFLFAGTADSGVFVSTNRGASWKGINTGLKSLRVSSLGTARDASGNAFLFAMLGGSGVWKRSISEIAGSLTAIGKDDVVSTFELKQNYPNPFNARTVISYRLKARSLVRLQVFDLLGREIITLLDGEVLAGSHSVAFDATECSSGIYFYRLQAGGFVETKKLVVLR